jgi:hypothetical protein
MNNMRTFEEFSLFGGKKKPIVEEPRNFIKNDIRWHFVEVDNDNYENCIEVIRKKLDMNPNDKVTLHVRKFDYRRAKENKASGMENYERILQELDLVPIGGFYKEDADGQYIDVATKAWASGARMAR